MSPEAIKKAEKFMETVTAVKSWFDAEKIEVSDLVIGRMAARIEDIILQRKKDVKPVKPIDNSVLIEIYNYYKEKIQPSSRSSEIALPKIKSRLKIYTKEELIKTIDLFSKDWWYMENNSTRGATWFFNSDARTEKFLGIVPRSKEKGGVYKESTPTNYGNKTVKLK